MTVQEVNGRDNQQPSPPGESRREGSTTRYGTSQLFQFCVICGAAFVPLRRTTKTCSVDCSMQHRRRLTRVARRGKYVPRPPRSAGVCGACGTVVPAPRSGPMPKWCEPCKARKRDEQVRRQRHSAPRRCYKCNAPVPDANRQPGVAVCDGCRVDPRKRRIGHEQRRRLRKYGITQHEYERLLQRQGARCAACATDSPGAKGWNIDHDHRTGRVRGLLCMGCNTALGLLNEDPSVIRALASYAEMHQTR